MMEKKLDDVYGMLRQADETEEWEVGMVPASLCELTPSVGQAMKEVLLLAANLPFAHVLRSINFIWAVDDVGKMHVSVEEVALIDGATVMPGLPVRRGVDARVSKDQKLGHPCVAPTGNARIAGEIYIDESTDEEGLLAWTLNVRSGRFHRTKERRPNLNQIKNAAKMFARSMGLPISLDLIADMRMGSLDSGVSS